jgi:hypothetical protein
MNEAKATELKWEKMPLTEETRSRLDRAVAELTPISGGRFHVIRHPFRKFIACRAGNLLFFDVGDGGRPSEILPLAITTDAPSRLLVPTRRTEDFDECCELLGLWTEEQRDRLRKFLLPRLAAPRSAAGSHGRQSTGTPPVPRGRSSQQVSGEKSTN